MNTPSKPAPVSNLTIAVPIDGDRLHGHFGGCTRFALAEVDRVSKGVLLLRTVEAPPHAPGVFPRWLRKQGVSAVIVSGIGHRALSLFAEQGIEVRAGTPGARLEDLIASYLDGALQAPTDGCSGHGHHHDHGHGEHHHHGHHQHGGPPR